MEPLDWLWMALFSSGMLLVLHLPGIRVGLNLSDEGYLWHGSDEVLGGAVPIRDFRAYDPGRYYWCALWMRLFGRGTTALRGAMLAAQFLGLTLGMAAVFAASGRWPATLLAGVALAAWMFPRHKQIDSLFPLAATFVAVRLVMYPGTGEHFLAGVFIGVSLFFGLNHALYAGAGMLLLAALMAWHGHGLAWHDALAWLGLGGLAGVLPALAWLFGGRGVAAAYWREKVEKVLRRGTSNLPLPVPWLWRTSPPNLGHLPDGTRWLLRAGYTLMPAFHGLIVLYAVLAPAPTTPAGWALLAVACIGLFYTHHALSRADLTHFAQASPPLLVGLALGATMLPHGEIALGALAALSLWLAHRPYARAAQGGVPAGALARVEIGGHVLRLSPDRADYLTRLNELVARHSTPATPVLFLPKLAALYPLFGRRPAVYDIFCVYPASEAEQEAMIRQIEAARPPLAIVLDYPTDGREELRFRNTHPRVWVYLRACFTEIDTAGRLPGDHHVFIQPTSS